MGPLDRQLILRKIVAKTLRIFNSFIKNYKIVVVSVTDQVINVKATNYFQDGMYIENQSSFRSESSFTVIKNKLISKTGIDYEMDWRTHIAMELSQYASTLDGDFVELGSGEGWIINAIMLRNPELASSREIHLFDKFDGLEVDIVFGNNQNDIHPRYPNDVQQFLMNLECKHSFIHTGILPQGLEVLANRRIAFLHIDLNAAETEAESLRRVYSLVVPSGIILLDDYCGRGREAQHEAINSVSRELNFSVINLPTGQGLIIKNH